MRAIFSRALPVKKSFRRAGTAILLASAWSAVFASPAGAADILRGSYVAQPQYYQWDGFYGGAQLGYNNADVNFGTATTPAVTHLLRNSTILDIVSDWTTLPNSSSTNSSFGGFIGYNWQWDDVVVGIEANYSRTKLDRTATDSLSRLFTDSLGHAYDLTVIGDSTIKITDLATLRARAGWAFGTFMPYGFIGFAVGRADVSTTATIVGTVDDGLGGGPAPLALSQTNARNGVFGYGGAVGLGFDWALSQNLFVRGEWELVQLQDFEGIDVRINTARAAVGLKF